MHFAKFLLWNQRIDESNIDFVMPKYVIKLVACKKCKLPITINSISVKIDRENGEKYAIE